MFIFSGSSSGQRKQVRRVYHGVHRGLGPWLQMPASFPQLQSRQSHLPNSPGFSPMHTGACDQAVQPASCMCNNVGNTPRFQATFVLLTPHGRCCANASTVTRPAIADPRSHPTRRETERASLSAPQYHPHLPVITSGLLLDRPISSWCGACFPFLSSWSAGGQRPTGPTDGY